MTRRKGRGVDTHVRAQRCTRLKKKKKEKRDDDEIMHLGPGAANTRKSLERNREKIKDEKTDKIDKVNKNDKKTIKSIRQQQNR